MRFGNPIFQDIFYTGFLTEKGIPNGYNRFFKAEVEYKDVKYLKAIKKLNTKMRVKI